MDWNPVKNVKLFSKSAHWLALAGLFLAPLAATHAETGGLTTADAPKEAPAAKETIGNVETVKILTVGNSFANDSVAYLEAIAKAAGKQAIVFRANLGGHSLEQHVGYINAFEKDPADPKG